MLKFSLTKFAITLILLVAEFCLRHDDNEDMARELHFLANEYRLNADYKSQAE